MRNPTKTNLICFFIWCLFFLCAFFLDSDKLLSLNLWSFSPIILLFLTALVTEDYYCPLILSTVLAFTFRHKTSAISQYINTLVAVLSNKDNLWLLLDISMIGGLIEVTKKSGVQKSVIKLFNTYNNKSLYRRIILLSLLFSFDDYFFPSLLSEITKSDTTLQAKKDQISFVCRGATISFANINPISWPIYTMSLLIINGLANRNNSIVVYYKIVAFMFFPLSFIIYLLVKINRQNKEYRTNTTEVINRKDLLNLMYTILPIIFHMSYSILEGDTLKPLIVTTCLMALFHAFRGCYSLLDIFPIIISGIKNMIEICVIIILSLCLSDALDSLFFTEHSVSLVSKFIPATLFPVVIFIFFGITEMFFSLNWTLWLISFPLIIQACMKINANTYLCLGAILSAGILGSISCMYSDSTVLSIKSFDLNIRSHYRTSISNVVPAVIVSILLYFLFGKIL